MRNYDWGFAPNPRQGYFPSMWPVDREATFGFGGSRAPEPSGGYGGGPRYRGFYDVEYEIYPYDNEIRRAAPGFGEQPMHGEPIRTVHPHGGYDRVSFRQEQGGGYGGYDRGGSGARDTGGGSYGFGGAAGYGNEYRGARGRSSYDAGSSYGNQGGRGEYGDSYPTFGGYPGGGGRGMYAGWDRQGAGGPNFGGGGYGGAMGRSIGYDLGYGGYGGHGAGSGIDRAAGRGGQGYADAPFVPEEAYRRHPELEAQPHHHDMAYGAPGDVGLELDDSEIFQSVRQRLYQDRYLDAEEITVMVSDGVVTLEGEVSDFMEARYAWDDAWETPGVRGVLNHLVVRTDAASVSHNDEMPQSAGGDASA